MRHRKVGKKLGREKGPRKALTDSLATSLVLYEKIVTTEAKAKAVKPLVEKLITRGKVKSVHNKQQLSKVIPDKYAGEGGMGGMEVDLGDKPEVEFGSEVGGVPTISVDAGEEDSQDVEEEGCGKVHDKKKKIKVVKESTQVADFYGFV